MLGGSGSAGSGSSRSGGVPRIRFAGVSAPPPSHMEDVEFVKDEDEPIFLHVRGAGAGAGAGVGAGAGGSGSWRGDLALKNPEDMTREELLLMFKTTTAQGAIDSLIRTVSTKTNACMVDHAMAPMTTISLTAVATREANRAAKLPYHEPLCVPAPCLCHLPCPA